MINPVNNQAGNFQTYPVSNHAKDQSAPAQRSAAPAVDSPVNEKNEPASEEMKESSAQKAAEALRALASSETAQHQAAIPQGNVNSQTASKAYQNSVK